MPSTQKPKLTIKAKNLGPHHDFTFSQDVSKDLKIGVFANNGSGKTFLSRALRLLDRNNLEETTDSSELVSFGQNQGSFSIEVKDGTVVEKTEINFSRTSQPEINHRSKYIFHVFNSDFVRDNIQVRNYSPDKGIDGYIIGEKIIDVSNDEAELKQLKNDLKLKQTALKVEIEKATELLKKNGVNSNTREFKRITIETVLNRQTEESKESFKDLVEIQKAFKSMPDFLEPLNEDLSLYPDFKIAEELKELFEKPFTKADFEESFKNKIKEKSGFIKEGVSFLNESEEKKCPFCEQDLIGLSLELIEKYKQYLADEEARVIDQIDKAIIKVETYKKEFIGRNNSFLKVGHDFDTNKKFIPSMKDVQIKIPKKPDTLSVNFDALKHLLSEKKKDISKPIEQEEFSKHLEAIDSFINDVSPEIEAFNNITKKSNLQQSKVKEENLSLNRKLCISKANEVINTNTRLIDEITDLVKKSSEKEQSIKTKKEAERKSKKEEYFKTFEQLLKAYFKDKYQFDRNSNCLTFSGNPLTNNVSKVLSEGEKSIVAFCHYLAEIHLKVEKQSEYQNLFFVIDDPISSLDFGYVYQTAQILRNLNSITETQRTRFLIFTHSVEFMGILMRNKILQTKLILQNGVINKLSEELIMPYHAHLRDVLLVSEGGRVSHTTGNSLRHILETLNRFKRPDIKLEEFCGTIDELTSDAHAYSFVQDLSHGIIRSEMPFSEDTVRSCCRAVIDYIGREYSGQIVEVRKNMKIQSDNIIELSTVNG